jgi:hypothetical protein
LDNGPHVAFIEHVVDGFANATKPLIIINMHVFLINDVIFNFHVISKELMISFGVVEVIVSILHFVIVQI